MTELGDVVREHRGTPWKRLPAVIVSTIMAIGCVWAIFEMKPKDPGKAWLVAIGFLALAGLFTVITVRDAGSRLVLHHAGLVYERGAARTIVRYDAIAAASETRVNGKPVALVLQLRGGGEVSIPAYLQNYEGAADAIARAQRAA